MAHVIDIRRPEGQGRGIAAAADAIRRGELVAMPTETVYGLAADATRADAVAKIFTAKGRPRFNPLIVHVASGAAASELAFLTDAAERLAAMFWPGPLTLVLPRRPTAPITDLVTAGLETIAVRIPDHPAAEALLAEVGVPLAAPSANRSGSVSATTAAHVAEDFGDAVAVILDAGPTAAGIESTIVGFQGDTPILLRPGAVPRADIESVLGTSLAGAGTAIPLAPGMLPSHYAPRVLVRLNALDVRPGESVLAFGDDLPTGAGHAVAVINLSPSGDIIEAAAHLFAALRKLDHIGAPIAVVPILDAGLGEAINDRLRRAAAPRP